MAKKPELVVFSMNRIGGVQSYYSNLLSNDQEEAFEKKWILTDCLVTKDARPAEPFNCCNEVIFEYQPSLPRKIADRLQKLVSNRPGVVLVNHELELVTMHRYRKSKKTLIFVCHDELYLENAVKYEFLIDAFIAHNIYFFEELKRRLPERTNDVYYLPYGIKLASEIRRANPNGSLKVLFLARLTEKKGVFDLQKIDDELLRDGVHVDWTILGDGPEKDKLMSALKDRKNFVFASPPNNDEVLKAVSKCDVYLLPSYLDGMPVALLEAMSAGLVPIVSRFNEGISAVLKEDNGFVVPVGDIKSFADKIKALHFDRNKLEKFSGSALKTVRENYEVVDRAKDYYTLFKKFRALKKPMVFRRKGYMGNWDYPWIPQFARELIRSI